ncbi:S1 RNA-binding domain-containing protein [Chloroflexus sp.]
MSDLDDYEGDPALNRERLSELLTDQLEELARTIHSRDQLVRARAASRLVNLEVDPDLVLPTLHHHWPAVREVAIEAIGYTSKPLSPAVIDALLASIDDPKPFVAAAAIRTLGRKQIAEAREQITACLDDPDPPIVAAAIAALARLGDTTLAVAIPNFLNSPHLAIRIAAAEAAGMLHTPAAVPGLLRLLEDCITAWQETQPHIPSRAASVAMQALARLRARTAIPLLVEIARYVVGLRTLAVRTLNQLQAVEAAPEIVSLLNEKSIHLSHEVIRLVKMADYRAALPELRALLQRSAPNRRSLTIQIMQILVEWNDRASMPLLAQLAESFPNAEIRHHAARCLTILEQVTTTSEEPSPPSPDPAPTVLWSERLRKRQERIASVSVGSIVEGTVLRVLSYGAVIDLGGIEGFVHVRDIDWRWISDARNVLQPGQPVRAMITNIDRLHLRINLSIRELTPDPWASLSQRLAGGMTVQGTVTGITGFGLFVELLPGIQGLVHISKIPAKRRPLRECFPLSSQVMVTILAIDNEHRRIALSVNE